MQCSSLTPSLTDSGSCVFGLVFSTWNVRYDLLTGAVRNLFGLPLWCVNVLVSLCLCVYDKGVMMIQEHLGI